MEEKKRINGLMENLGIDIETILRLSFSGFKQLKRTKQLYSSDVTIPEELIKLYYSVKPGKISFDKMKKVFVTRYINNESKLEGVNDETIHGKVEIEGIRKMYEYIHSDDIEYMFDVYTLKELHRQLFSCSKFPEYGGDFRNFNVYLPGTGTDLSDYSMIRPSLNELDPTIKKIRDLSKKVKESEDADFMLLYLDLCVEIACKMIKIHPFSDGNGRTVRGFMNKLLEDAGLPPIYIKTNERLEYQQAMNRANNENDYADIKNFYRYKICDSILELDLNYNEKSKDKIFKNNNYFLLPIESSESITIKNIKDFYINKTVKYFDYTNIDIDTIIRLSFCGYKYLKSKKQLYSSDAGVPENLIKMYYNLSSSKINFDNIKSAFITRYINNESKIENVDEESYQGKREKEGFRKMYNYIHEVPINNYTNPLILVELFQKLFDVKNLDINSNNNVVNKNSVQKLFKYSDEINFLFNIASKIKILNDSDLILKYLDKCVVLSSKLIKEHVFPDGNGRIIRCFTNKLFEEAGLPPVYIKAQEKSEYHDVIHKALEKQDYEDIKKFYRYKICDSIIELDINERMNKKHKLKELHV